MNSLHTLSGRLAIVAGSVATVAITSMLLLPYPVFANGINPAVLTLPEDNPAGFVAMVVLVATLSTWALLSLKRMARQTDDLERQRAGAAESSPSDGGIA